MRRMGMFVLIMVVMVLVGCQKSDSVLMEDETKTKQGVEEENIEQIDQTEVTAAQPEAQLKSETEQQAEVETAPVSVVEVKPEKVWLEVLVSDFNTPEHGWTPRIGTEVLTLTEVVNKKGFSLKVTGREKAYYGIKYDLLGSMENHEAFEIEAWVYHEGDGKAAIHMTMEKTAGGETTYSRLGTAEGIPGEWTKIKTKYTSSVTDDLSGLYLYFEADKPTMDFYIDDVVIRKSVLDEPVGIEAEMPSLYKAYSDHFSVGVATNPATMKDPITRELILKHFDSITAGNSMKPDAMLSKNSRGEIRFEVSDVFEAFGDQLDTGLRGHTLLWHNQTPDWFFKENYEDNGALVDRDTMLNRLDWYIGEVAGAYTQDSLYVWDVVNEAIDTNQSDNLRHSVWYDTIGPDYVEKAFEFARKHTKGSDVKLIYNDYNVVSNRKKREAIYEMVVSLQEKGLIDGVGLQSHVNLYSPTTGAFEETIDLFGSLGLEVQITELDVSIYTNNDQRQEAITEDQLKKQADRYKDLFEVFVAHDEVVTNVTMWGLTDNRSWLNNFPVKNRPNWPLLFDEYYHVKPAFTSILEVVAKETSSTLDMLDNDGSDKLVVELDMNKPVIALTFDDGPNTTTTMEVLSKLDRYNVPATFFVIGENITETTSEIMKKAYDMGCELGNHSLTHRDMTSMTSEVIKDEVSKTSAKIKAVTGEDPKFFRPPYIAVNDVMLDAIDLPFASGISANDWEDGVTADERAEKIIAQAEDGAIILLHDMDGNSQTVDALDTLIPKLQESGFQFVTLSDLFEFKGVERDGQSEIIYQNVLQTTNY